MPKPRREPTELELAYAAGIVDGEGCISIVSCEVKKRHGDRKPGDSRYQYRVKVKMVDTQAVYLLFEIFGGSIWSEKKGKGCRFRTLTWSVGEKRAANCCRKLLPYLRVKRHQAEILLQFSEICSRDSGLFGGKTKFVSPEVKEERMAVIELMRNANQRVHLNRGLEIEEILPLSG